MKKTAIIYSLLFAAIFSCPAFGQWIELDTVGYGNFDVHFRNSHEGYVAGKRSGWTYIEKTTDKGLSWQQVFIDKVNTTGEEPRIAIDNTGNLWLLYGNNWVVLNATNDAIIKHVVNYIQPDITPGERNILLDIEILPSGVIFMTINQGVIRSTDNGETWIYTKLGFNAGVTPSSISFYGDSIGYVVDAIELYRTTDGGSTWVNQNSSNFSTIVAIDSLRVLAARDGIWFSEDGGVNFELSDGIDLRNEWFFDLSMIDGLHGWACGTKVAYTSDGGKSWVNNMPDEGSFYAVYSTSIDTVYVAGHPRMLWYNYNAQLGTSIESESNHRTLTSDGVGLSPNPTNNLLTVQATVPIENVSLFSDVGLNQESIFNYSDDSKTTVSISTQHLESGVYFVQVRVTDSIITRKFVVVK